MTDETQTDTGAETAAEGAAEASTEDQSTENGTEGADGAEAGAPEAADAKKNDGDNTADTESDEGQKESDTEADAEDWKLTAPEGLEAHQEALDAFAGDMGAWLKENPEATPQEALAEAARRQAEAVQKAATDQQADFDKQVDGWNKQTRAAKDIGGDKYDENVALAVKGLEALDTFRTVKGDDGKERRVGEMAEVLEASGLGSHPAFVRAFMKIGEMVSDRGLVDEGQSGQGQSSLNSRYPTSTANAN